MPRGLPSRITAEAGRRSQLVRVVVYLERGALEDLELLIRDRDPWASRSEIVRQAVSWLRARRAADLVRLRAAQAHRAARAAEEQRALAISRQDRDQEQAADLVADALALINTKGSDG
jgi:Arc/MetJ-type ribon-helix-helix transcriptional regulator